jgi:predicted aspartyl protease
VGLTHLIVEVANPARPARRARLKMLVDSGAAYSIVDAATLRRLGIRPTGTRTFILADGTEVTRRTGAALFRLRADEGASTVIFGEPGDATLLGVVTLEELGLVLDPMRRELRPMPPSLMPLGSAGGPLARAALGTSGRPPAAPG